MKVKDVINVVAGRVQIEDYNEITNLTEVLPSTYAIPKEFYDDDIEIIYPSIDIEHIKKFGNDSLYGNYCKYTIISIIKAAD